MRCPVAFIARCVALGILAVSLHAETAVPVPLQATIFVKALAYDRALRGRAGADLVIGVVYKESDRADAKLALEVRDAFGSLQTPIQGLPLKVVARPFRDAAALAEWVVADGVDVFYVSPGLGGEVAVVKAQAKKSKIVTMSPARALVHSGIAMGVVAGPDNRPRVIVNLAAAEALGMNLDSKLLQLAEVIR